MICSFSLISSGKLCSSKDETVFKLGFCTENKFQGNKIHLLRLVTDSGRAVSDLVLTFCRHIFDNDSILPVSIGDRRLNSGSYDLGGPGILAKLLNLTSGFCSFPQFAEQTRE